MNYLGKAIKIARLNRNMTQKEVAQNICTQATISNIEKAGSIPSKEILFAIAERLDIEFDAIYGFINEDATKNNKIMKQVRILCSQSKHNDASSLLKGIDENLLSSSLEKKEFYYYKGMTSLVGFENYSDAHYYFNLVNSMPLENGLSIYDLLANNGICTAYSMNNDNKKADVYMDKTLALLDDFLNGGYDKKDTIEVIRIYFNSAKIKSKEKNYKKALDLCSLGIGLQQLNDNKIGLEHLLYEKAYNLCMLNKKSEAEKFYFYAAAMAMINKNNEMSKTISSDMELYKVRHFMY